MSPKMCYVAVHGGAGQHGRVSDARVKDAMKRACAEGLRLTSELPSLGALSIVERAIAVLEDDDCLNAGYGSNLTFEGTVECDAALMDGRTGDFGSVGAVPGFERIRNPIKLARAVLAHAHAPDKLGRLRPLTLVASGARVFAQRYSEGIEVVDPGSMIAPRAKQDWQRWMARYNVADLGVGTDGGSRPKVEMIDTDTNMSTTPPLDATMQDTVGAIAWDSDGNLAAGVSSGGLLLKYTGRIGEAATFGAGCWAEQSRDGGGMACSISGAGEYIVRAGLARALANAVRTTKQEEGEEEVDVHDALMRTLSTQFYDPIIARGETHPNAGVLLVTKELQKSGDVLHGLARLWCAFTTESMAVAYANSDMLTPKAKILRRPRASLQPGLSTTPSPVYITALPLHR